MRRRRIVNIGGYWINPDRVDMIVPRSAFTNDPGMAEGNTVIKLSSGYVVTNHSPEDVAKWLFGRHAARWGR